LGFPGIMLGDASIILPDLMPLVSVKERYQKFLWLKMTYGRLLPMPQHCLQTCSAPSLPIHPRSRRLWLKKFKPGTS